MRSKTIILCAALSVLAIAYLPLGGAVTCDVDPTDPDCVNCTDTPDDPECVAPTEAPTEAPASETTAPGEETTVPTDNTETTTAASENTTSSGRGKKIKFKIVKKTGKKVIKRRRSGKGKGIFNKGNNNRVNRRSKGGRRF